jgi:hypothetical protein
VTLSSSGSSIGWKKIKIADKTRICKRTDPAKQSALRLNSGLFFRIGSTSFFHSSIIVLIILVPEKSQIFSIILTHWALDIVAACPFDMTDVCGSDMSGVFETVFIMDRYGI